MPTEPTAEERAEALLSALDNAGIADWETLTAAALTITNGKIAEIDFLTDPERIAQLDLAVLGD